MSFTRLTNLIRVQVDNIYVTKKQYTMSTQQNSKQITLNYLNNNNIKYYTTNNTIISFPTKHYQLNNFPLILNNSHKPQLIHHNNTTILIHSFNK